ncbi:MAG TPA: transposase [Micromonosporaceae bacterium]|nr:transposase [Micromonosporaceae bacterium]
MNAILYVVDNGIEWWALPSDFQLWSTVYNYFAAWEAAGITQDVLDGLRDRVRLVEGRVAAPSAARRSTAGSGTSRWTPWTAAMRTGHRRVGTGL